jgi:hypothetical protein
MPKIDLTVRNRGLPLQCLSALARNHEARPQEISGRDRELGSFQRLRCSQSEPVDRDQNGQGLFFACEAAAGIGDFAMIEGGR